MLCSWSSSGASFSSNLICWCVYVYPSLHIDQVRRSFFFFQKCLHFTYSIRYTGVDVHESMNPSFACHIYCIATRLLRHARSPRWAPAEGPAIHQDLGMECPLEKEGFSYTYVWNHLKSWWYLCGAHRFCELLWHFFGLKFVLIDQVEPHLVESPRRPTSESVCFRLLAKRRFFITYSMATFSNIVISSEPRFPFHPKHPGGAWSLQVMSSQLGKTQRFVLGRGITSSFWHGPREVHGLGKQKSLTSLNFGTLCFGACKSWRATRCCICSAPVNLYNPTNRVLHIGLHGRDDRLLKWHEVNQGSHEADDTGVCNVAKDCQNRHA